MLAAILPPPAEAEPLEWPAEIGNHISATQLTMFQRCPEQYRRVYVKGERQRPGAALVWGSADHYAHEQNFIQKIGSGVDISEDDVKVAFAEGFDQAVERNGGAAEIEWGTDKPGQMKDAGTELVAAYHRQVSPRLQPVSVEEAFTVVVPGVPVPVVGRIDVRATVDGRGERAIERKTAKSKSATVKPEWRIQGLLYQAVGMQPVDWHVSVKTKTPAVYTPEQEHGLMLPFNPVTVAATKVLVQNTVRAIIAYWRMYGPNEAWPGAITHPWACDFCGFRVSCRWWET